MEENENNKGKDNTGEKTMSKDAVTLTIAFVTLTLCALLCYWATETAEDVEYRMIAMEENFEKALQNIIKGTNAALDRQQGMNEQLIKGLNTVGQMAKPRRVAPPPPPEPAPEPLPKKVGKEPEPENKTKDLTHKE